MPITAGVPSVPKSMPAVRSFTDGTAPMVERSYYLTGVTRDSVGTPLGGCTMVLFRTADNSIAAQNMMSDPTTGAFSVAASPSLQHYFVFYKAGSPDVAGTTLNTLVAT